jgi:hypothetical protein
MNYPSMNDIIQQLQTIDPAITIDRDTALATATGMNIFYTGARQLRRTPEYPTRFRILPTAPSYAGFQVHPAKPNLEGWYASYGVFFEPGTTLQGTSIRPTPRSPMLDLVVFPVDAVLQVRR